ncbi:MAG TPA: tripartite tricarboxylate transporter TctB family protein [Syntrophorhabdaceae bacterium]|nr:tripartite tricarboxylate transporter TctB family protein [Syntrophorhabdaceae bacterium]
MNTDKATSIFWLCVSAVVAVASLRLGLGKISMPGSGFTPFGASVLLGILSIVCFFQSNNSKKSEDAGPLFRGMLWPRVVLVFIALFAYARLIPFGGYNVTTFLLLVLLFRIAGQRQIWKAIVYALITTALSYYVFSKWLNLQFPIGPLGF